MEIKQSQYNLYIKEQYLIFCQEGRYFYFIQLLVYLFLVVPFDSDCEPGLTGVDNKGLPTSSNGIW